MEGGCYGCSGPNYCVESIAVNAVSIRCSCKDLFVFLALFEHVSSELEGGCYGLSGSTFCVEAIAVNAVPFRCLCEGFFAFFSLFQYVSS